MIPAEAVEAAAKVLLGYTGACVCHEGYTGRNLVDPECRYHDVPPEVAKEILEAAAPYMQGESREMALIARERKRKLDAVTSIAARLGESMQGDDRELSEELYAAMGLD